MKKEEKTDNSLSLKILKFIRMGLFLLLSGIVLSNIQAVGKRSEQARLLPSSKPSSVISTEATKTPFPSTKTGTPVKKAAQPSPTPTSDYVRCNISATCGGGYKEMTKSTCDEMVCCTYSLDYPPMFTSRSDCEARVKQNTKPVLTPDWQYQTTYTNPSSSTTNNSDNEAYRQALITECKQKAKRTTEDMLALCPVTNGTQDSNCVARAQETGSQVSMNCDNIK